MFVFVVISPPDYNLPYKSRQRTRKERKREFTIARVEDGFSYLSVQFLSVCFLIAQERATLAFHNLKQSLACIQNYFHSLDALCYTFKVQLK